MTRVLCQIAVSGSGVSVWASFIPYNGRDSIVSAAEALQIRSDHKASRTARWS
jgi:hypothetical protein